VPPSLEGKRLGRTEFGGEEGGAYHKCRMILGGVAYRGCRTCDATAAPVKNITGFDTRWHTTCLIGLILNSFVISLAEQNHKEWTRSDHYCYVNRYQICHFLNELGSLCFPTPPPPPTWEFQFYCDQFRLQTGSENRLSEAKTFLLFQFIHFCWYQSGLSKNFQKLSEKDVHSTAAQQFATTPMFMSKNTDSDFSILIMDKHFSSPMNSEKCQWKLCNVAY